ncbi:IS5 family transposase [Planctomicrobium sp. SH661]|uniref:IS5 family transposase n=1 Tax=Planctomicrobium sp. SH661 TaxID=3448124 RepID=UPI003F5C491B
MHAALDRSGTSLVRLILTAGQRGDAPQGRELLNQMLPGTIGHVVADAAYDSNALREQIGKLKAKACIRPNPRRKQKKRYSKDRYKHRNVIERFFCRLKRCRRVATRYEKKARNFAGFLWLAAFLTNNF